MKEVKQEVKPPPEKKEKKKEKKIKQLFAHIIFASQFFFFPYVLFVFWFWSRGTWKCFAFKPVAPRQDPPPSPKTPPPPVVQKEEEKPEEPPAVVEEEPIEAPPEVVSESTWEIAKEVFLRFFFVVFELLEVWSTVVGPRKTWENPSETQETS